MINEKEIIYGLSSLEAEKRIKKYGLNIIEKKKKISPLKIFISQFNDFIVWVLIVATIISAFIGEQADAITILIIIVLNAFLGFFQEYRTEKSLEALKKMAAPNAKVYRDKRIQVIKAEKIVPDDIILVESGDRVPADCEIIKSTNLLVDEALLTGESVGILKSKENNKVYMGTTVLVGKGEGKVIKTGMNSEMGKIASLLNDIEEERTPLKEKLTSLGKVLVFCCVIICIIVTFLGIIRGQDKYQMFLVGVSLAVAAIPEGLAAIVTVALGLGVSRMLKRKALVRKLPAVETLGCTSIICSDKTGTLTKNEMTVKKIYYDGITYEKDFNNRKLVLLKKAVLYCNDCTIVKKGKDISKNIIGDPTEAALIKAFFNKEKEYANFIKDGNKIKEIPFDSSRKLMSVLISENGERTAYVKGAPEKIIKKCKFILLNEKVILLSQMHKKKLENIIERMAGDALRCIAVSYKKVTNIREFDEENNLIFLGILGMIDPPREEVKEAVRICKKAGIKPIMITGDHKITAFSIGKELDICSNKLEVMTGEELDKLSDKKFSEIIDSVKVYARVNPEHKLKIVKEFKRKGKIVAMTGDGVNDAPAVKEADIGIAMGISGTDVTKEASSMILLDDNFTTIVAAVEEGRIIYNNIRKFIRYLLSCNLGEVLTMFLASLFYLETPLLPIQILLVNLATDGLPAIALGVDPSDLNVMDEIPRDKNESIFSKGLKEKIIIRGSLIGVCTIFSFLVGKYLKMNISTCRTLALGTLIMSQLIHVFECRSEKYSIFQIKFFTNIYLVIAVLISIGMLLSVIYLPFFRDIFHTSSIGYIHWVIIIFFSGGISLINSLYLWLNR